MAFLQRVPREESDKAFSRAASKTRQSDHITLTSGEIRPSTEQNLSTGQQEQRQDHQTPLGNGGDLGAAIQICARLARVENRALRTI
jgi:hypothetical protein